MNPSTYIPIIILWIIIFIMFRNQKAVVAKKIIKNRKMEDKAEMIELAKESEIILLATDKRMYEACGILYSNGLVGNRAKNV